MLDQSALFNTVLQLIIAIKWFDSQHSGLTLGLFSRNVHSVETGPINRTGQIITSAKDELRLFRFR